MTKRLSHRLSFAGRLAALLTTSYFLVATSEPADPPITNTNTSTYSQLCMHTAQSVSFQVSGTCGPSGIITVSSPQDECFVTVAGAAAVGLPAAGRFNFVSGAQTVELLKDGWTLSDVPPDPVLGAIPVAPVSPDAGVAVDALPSVIDARPDSTFGVVTDGATRSVFGVVDAYSATTTPSSSTFHPTPLTRECRVTVGNQTRFSCTGAQVCGGTLIRI